MGDLGSPKQINDQGSGFALNLVPNSQWAPMRLKELVATARAQAPRVGAPGFMASNNGYSKCFCFCFCHRASPTLELLLKLSSVVANSGVFAHHPPPHSLSHYQSDGSACCHLSPAPSYPALFFLSSQHCLSAGFDLSSYTVSHTSLDRKNNLR